MTLSQQAKQIRLLLRELIHRTLGGRFVGPPPKQLGAMAETIAGDMIVADFDDEGRLKRMPDVLFALIPATGPPGADPVKPGRAMSLSSFSVSAGRSIAAMLEVKPT
jgi:hypothetical protein